MFWNKKKRENQNVANYYNQSTERYLQTYGNVIQAFRPKSTTDLLDYIIKSAHLQNGQEILDAGCGVGGPAIYFAQKLNLTIEGITISPTQVKKAKEYINKTKLNGFLNIIEGDFHNLSNYYPSEKFDRILFLESLGHAQNLEKVITETVPLLKAEGKIYIKDFFPFEIIDKETSRKHKEVIENINDSYCYNVLNLQILISLLRQQKLEIEYIRKFDFQDDITARASFENAEKIDLFGNNQEFRVAEWLELCFVKPEEDLF